MPVGTSSIRAQSRGLTARPASHCHLSHCSKSWRHSCRCHGSTWSALGGVWRRTVCGAGRSSRDTAPTGCGWASYHHRVVSLELGAAAAASVCPGSDALPVLSAWRAPDHCRHHPRGAEHVDPPASAPGVHPTSPCPRPFSPRDVRLGGLSSRHRMWPRGRRACDGGVSRERATPLRV